MDKAGSATVRLGHWVSLLEKCAGLCHACANGRLVSLESHRKERMRDRERETEMVWHDGVTRGERMEVKVSDACSHRKDSSQMRSFRYVSNLGLDGQEFSDKI